MGQDTSAVRQSIATLNATIGEQVRKMNEMVRAGQMGTKEFTQLNAAIRKNEGALRTLNRQLGDTGKKFGGLDMGQIGGALTGGIIGGGAATLAIEGANAIRQAFTQSIQDASDLNETVTKTGVIFGDASAEIMAYAETAANSIGQSKQQAMDAATTFGVFGKAAGLAGSDLAKFSTDFVTLASDMASFSNTTPEQAITAIGAALRGESEPIRQYGVLLNDATLKQEAMELGIYDGNGALSMQQKILAAQAAIYKQTGDAQGDFNRTSDGLANQQRILAANTKDLSAAMGQVFTPIAAGATTAMLGLVNAARALPAFINENAVAIGSIGAALIIYNSQMIAARTASLAMMAAQRAQALVTSAVTAAQYALNVAMSANPVGAIITGISLLVAGLGIAYNSSQKFRAAVAGIGAVAVEMFNIVKETLGGFVEGFKLLISGDFIAGIKTIGSSLIRLNPIGIAVTEGKRLAGAFGKGYSEKIKSEETKAAAKEGGKAIAKATAKGIEESQPEIKTAAAGAAKAAIQEIKTAADVFGSTMEQISEQEGYYALIGDDLGRLQSEHQALQSAMKAAWEAGGYGAANYVLALKAQDDELKKLLASAEEMKKTPPAAPMIATGGQRRLGAAGGIVLPQENRTKQIDEESAAFQRQKMIAEELNNVYNQMGQSFGSMMESLASGSATAQEAFRAFAISALNAAQQFIQAQIAAAAAAQIKENSKFGLPGIALAGVAVAGLFGLLRGALSRSKSVKLAQGGIISGRTMAEVGEYPGAAFNPEVVAPLDKLQAMLDIGGSTHVTGTFRVQGSDLVLALDNAQRKMNQFRV